MPVLCLWFISVAPKKAERPSVHAWSESVVSCLLETRNERMFPVAVPFTKQPPLYHSPKRGTPTKQYVPEHVHMARLKQWPFGAVAK